MVKFLKLSTSAATLSLFLELDTMYRELFNLNLLQMWARQGQLLIVLPGNDLAALFGKRGLRTALGKVIHDQGVFKAHIL